jgi:hypothetical protein
VDGVRSLCTAGGDIVDGVRRLCTAYAVHKGVGRFCRARLGAVARLIKIQTKNKINPRRKLAHSSEMFRKKIPGIDYLSKEFKMKSHSRTR